MECMYQQLNKALRNKDRQHLVSYFSYLKLFLTGLWQLVDIKCLVYRGVKANISRDYPKGKKFVWWGLSSCTTSLNVLQTEQFLGKTDTRTLFNIECFNGENIQNHSQFPNENEVLLLPCSYLEVLSELDQGNGLHIVHIKQIEPPVILIQPPSPSFALPHPSKSSNNIESMTSNFTGMNVSQTASSSSKKTNAPTTKKTLNLNMLKEKPRLSIKADVISELMAANNEYLIFSSRNGLMLIDKEGHEKLSIEPDFNVYDICWSSFLYQFLILAHNYNYICALHSLHITTSGYGKLKEIKRFDEEMASCAGYDEILMISSRTEGGGGIIEEYNLSNWKLKRTFKSPIPCEMKQIIYRIQLSSTGTHLGVLLLDREADQNNYHWSFQLRRPSNMDVLRLVSLGNDRRCCLVAICNGQFLANTIRGKEFFLIDSDGQLKEIVDYRDDAKLLISAVLIGAECLVIGTEGPNEFHFYDL